MLFLFFKGASMICRRGYSSASRSVAVILAALAVSTSLAHSIEPMSGAGVVPQPPEMSIDPVRDGKVIVLSRDGRYLEAAFGGTPWTDIHPRSTYLLSTCVEDRAFEAPIIKRIIDLSGCEIVRRDRPLIAHSAIPTITFRGFGFIFGPVVLPNTPHIGSIQPFPAIRPPVFAASIRPPIVGAAAGWSAPVIAAGPRHLTTSATGITGTVVIAGGNAYTFQWGNGVAWTGAAGPSVPWMPHAPAAVAFATPPIIPPAIIGRGGLIATTVVTPRPAFNLPPMHPVRPIIAHVGTRGFNAFVTPPLGINPNIVVPRIPGSFVTPPNVVGPPPHPVVAAQFNWVDPTSGVPPLVSSAIKPPLAFAAYFTIPPIAGPRYLPPVLSTPGINVFSVPGINAPLVTGGSLNLAHSSVSATGPAGTVVITGGNAFTFQWGNGNWIGGAPAAPNVYAAITPLAGINANITVPQASGSIAPPTIVGGPSFHPVFGAAFNWVEQTPGVPSLVSSAITPPLGHSASFAALSVVPPLYLPPVAYANILPAGNNIVAASGFQQPGSPGAFGHGGIWNAVAPSVRLTLPTIARATMPSAIPTGPPPGYSGHVLHASSFHPGLTAHTAGSPITFGHRR